MSNVRSVTFAGEGHRIKFGSLAELWRYRELLYFFAWRDVKVRYRQAAFGAAWAVLQPLLSMVLFTFVFGRLAHMPSNGIPYPVFCYCSLVPWTYFSTVVTMASNSLVNNDSLLTKVYFPRVLLPLGAVIAGILDLVIALLLLAILMIYYHVHTSWAIWLSPVVILMMVLVTAGVSMVLATINVRYRDVKYALPFLIQGWMFATPVIYPASVIPERFRAILSLNPCWGMEDGFRACMFRGWQLDYKLMATSIAVAIVVFFAGIYYFRRQEKSFADVI